MSRLLETVTAGAIVGGFALTEGTELSEMPESGEQTVGAVSELSNQFNTTCQAVARARNSGECQYRPAQVRRGYESFAGADCQRAETIPGYETCMASRCTATADDLYAITGQRDAVLAQSGLKMKQGGIISNGWLCDPRSGNVIRMRTRVEKKRGDSAASPSF